MIAPPVIKEKYPEKYQILKSGRFNRFQMQITNAQTGKIFGNNFPLPMAKTKATTR
jgi:hypothetical protein